MQFFMDVVANRKFCEWQHEYGDVNPNQSQPGKGNFDQITCTCFYMLLLHISTCAWWTNEKKYHPCVGGVMIVFTKAYPSFIPTFKTRKTRIVCNPEITLFSRFDT